MLREPLPNSQEHGSISPMFAVALQSLDRWNVLRPIRSDGEERITHSFAKFELGGVIDEQGGGAPSEGVEQCGADDFERQVRRQCGTVENAVGPAGAERCRAVKFDRSAEWINEQNPPVVGRSGIRRKGHESQCARDGWLVAHGNSGFVEKPGPLRGMVCSSSVKDRALRNADFREAREKRRYMTTRIGRLLLKDGYNGDCIAVCGGRVAFRSAPPATLAAAVAV